MFRGISSSGKNNSPEPSDSYVGFKIDEGSLKAVSSDGSREESTDLGPIEDGRVYNLRALYDPDEACDMISFWIGDERVAAHDGTPVAQLLKNENYEAIYCFIAPGLYWEAGREQSKPEGDNKLLESDLPTAEYWTGTEWKKLGT